ncbi:hypothetical protein KJ365_02050 [Glaciecola sp. XM2]|jgi:hypothetical protein|uniref:hypothetical protein n=1 Tax=Glaciecola sp. XM2 TaxID=1914931 RepID=UPI001BDEEC2A|nr:hypothetical protein [Glaciecola sp. XM2]MBT1449648.1 hypothetical protein [Glaciecola sp. XM2]
MTGKAFIRFLAKRGIPLSCIATKLNCKLDTLRSLERVEHVPQHYVASFIYIYQDSLSEQDRQFLAQ